MFLKKPNMCVCVCVRKIIKGYLRNSTYHAWFFIKNDFCKIHIKELQELPDQSSCQMSCEEKKYIKVIMKHFKTLQK